MDVSGPILTIETVQKIAERILADTFMCSVRTTVSRITDENRRNQVYRCEIHDTSADLPRSVIIKQAMHGNGILNDWAGVQFLSGLNSTIGPRYYGGDRDSGLLIIEDVKDAKGIDDILLSGSAVEAESILLRFAHVIGEMHSCTVGRYSEYQSIRDELAFVGLPSSVRNISADVRKTIAAVANQIDIEIDENFYQELSSIEMKMYSPGPFQVFSHGDPCPDNWLCNDGATKLIDYEFAGYKHALLDGSYGHIMFPTCWCAGIIPKTIVSKMEKVYRTELSRGCPEVADDAVFRAELFAACAYWTWDTVRGLLQGALESSHVWGIATTRARIVSRLAVLLSMAEDVTNYQLIRSVSNRLHEIVSSLWPEDKLQLYPCFQREASEFTHMP